MQTRGGCARARALLPRHGRPVHHRAAAKRRPARKQQARPLPRQIGALRIEALAGSGDGFGRHDGLVVFVENTAPGDRVGCHTCYESTSAIHVQPPAAQQTDGTARAQVSCELPPSRRAAGRGRANFAKASLVEVVEPSEDRRAARCPVAAECGGCQWQQLEYPAQLRWKEQLFHEQLVRRLGAEAALAVDETVILLTLSLHHY